MARGLSGTTSTIGSAGAWTPRRSPQRPAQSRGARPPSEQRRGAAWRSTMRMLRRACRCTTTRGIEAPPAKSTMAAQMTKSLQPLRRWSDPLLASTKVLLFVILTQFPMCTLLFFHYADE